MAKRKGRRKFRRYLRGNIDHKLELGTLGANTVIKTNVADSVVDTAWMSSVKATWSLTGFTKGADDGPILVGIAHSDYATTEIEEFVENITGSWDAGDLVSQEIAKRKIRLVGMLGIPPAVDESDVLNDGRLLNKKAGWMLSPADTVGIWAYNAGDSPLTTGAEIRVQGHANLWPR